MMPGRCGDNPFAGGTVAANVWEATRHALEARAAEFADAWRNGNRGGVLDEIQTTERPALLTALFVLELESEEADRFVRMLAARVIS